MRWKCQSGKSAAIGKQLPQNALAELGRPEELQKKAVTTANTLAGDSFVETEQRDTFVLYSSYPEGDVTRCHVSTTPPPHPMPTPR